MPASKIAERYAKGFLDFSQENSNTEVVFSEMKELVSLLGSSRELAVFLGTPLVTARSKEDICLQIFHSFSPVFRKLISVVIRNGRERCLAEIAEAYIRKVEAIKGVQHISIRLAASLSDKNIEAILRVSPLVDRSKKHEVKCTIDPSILGGYVLRVGDIQQDESVRNKLKLIGKEFEENRKLG